jgi:hypothetical protein
MPRARRLLTVVAVAGAIVAGAATAPATLRSTRSAALRLTDWPEFALNPQRTGATADATGITAANAGRLSRRVVALPGTADNAAIYLHAATVAGAVHDVAIVTTTYGITLAVDADSGRILWRFTPAGIAAWQGGAQITTASPLAHGGYVYATSPDGLVHKLTLAGGREAPGWPVRITPLPEREKLTASLNIAGGELLATTGGYFGDAPPYVGHIAAISMAQGRVDHVFNTLCANRTQIIDPRTCSASDSAILSRSGPVVEAGATRVLIATGNAPYNGSTNFGDSVIELTLPGLRLRQAYTPTDQQHLNTGDLDLGSGSPALLPGQLALIGGKDRLLRLLDLDDLDGDAPGSAPHTGGEIETLPTPGSQELFSAPAVLGRRLFIADAGGTAAYVVSGRRLRLSWQNGNAGTSPVLAGGLLYVYDMTTGGIRVYDPSGGRQVALLPTDPGHWNSPIVVDGHVIEPTGDGNAHRTHGRLDIFSLPA